MDRREIIPREGECLVGLVAWRAGDWNAETGRFGGTGFDGRDPVTKLCDGDRAYWPLHPVCSWRLSRSRCASGR